MSEHVVIRRPEYVAGTSEKPEVGVFTQANARSRPVSWGKIAAGDKVWMKWSAGPIVARATVAGFHQLENCSPSKLRLTTAGFSLHDLTEYWESLSPKFNAITIYLTDEQWLEEPVDAPGRSFGSSWLVFSSEADREKWLLGTTLPELGASNAKKKRKGIGKKLRFLVLKK